MAAKARRICGAKLRNGKPCGKTAGWGTTHRGYGRCRAHEGSHESSARVAKREEIEERLARFGEEVEIDPSEALLREVWRTNGRIVFYDEEIAHAQRSGQPWSSAEIQIINGMQADERDRLVRVAAKCIETGLAERQLVLAENMAKMIAAAMLVAVGELQLTHEQRALLPSALRLGIESVSSSSP